MKNNHLECVTIFLIHGANIDVKILRNQNPIKLVCSSKMSALLSLDDKYALHEACDNIIASQSCIMSTINKYLSRAKYSHP